MSILLLFLLTGLAVVIAGVWLAIKLLATAASAVGWLVESIFGNGRPHGRFIEQAARCPNEQCGAEWRANARFCGRCGRARGDVAPRLRLAGGVSRVA